MLSQYVIMLHIRCVYTVSLPVKHILKINENATLVFSIFFQHGLFNQNFVVIRQFDVTYSIKRILFVLIDRQYVLFKSTCLKSSYLTPCYVPHEWFVFILLGAPLHTLSNLYDVPVGFVTPLLWGCVLLNLRSPKGGCCSISDDMSCSFIYRGLLADWLDNIFPTYKCRKVFSISKYSKIKTEKKIAKKFRASGSGKLEGRYPPVYESRLHFVCTKHWYNISYEMLHTIEISILQHCKWRHEITALASINFIEIRGATVTECAPVISLCCKGVFISMKTKLRCKKKYKQIEIPRL